MVSWIFLKNHAVDDGFVQFHSWSLKLVAALAALGQTFVPPQIGYGLDMSGYVPPQGTLLPILCILAGADCEEPRLVLIDFGLAEGFLSTSSGCSGTAGYIPPETWETEHWYPKGHGWTSYKLESPNMLGVIGHMSVYKGISTLSTSSGLGNLGARRYFQHGHRLLPADDRPGAQWRSFGNLADLWQERTGRLIRPATWVNW